MKTKKKTIIFLVIALVIILVAIIAALAFTNPQLFVNDGELYTYVYNDGTVIEYYMDKDGHPYNYKDGKKIYVSLPLEQFVVTGDAEEQYKDEISSIENEINSQSKP